MRFKSLTITIICLLITNLNVYASTALLESGTKIKLKLDEKITSSINEEGDVVNFIVSDNVLDGDSVLIKAGSRATGVITERLYKKGFGQEGYLKVEFDYVIAIDGQKVPLRGYFDEYGDSDYMPLISLILLPFTPFIKGDDASFNAGHQVFARIENDMNINIDSL